MPAMSAFLLLVCSFQIYSGLMKGVALDRTAWKRLRNGGFSLICSQPIFSYFHTNSYAMLCLVH